MQIVSFGNSLDKIRRGQIDIYFLLFKGNVLVYFMQVDPYWDNLLGKERESK